MNGGGADGGANGEGSEVERYGMVVFEYPMLSSWPIA